MRRGEREPGWTIIDDPELHLGAERADPDILVPDLGGWRAGRLVDREDEDEPFITVVPDWVCEVLSPGTLRTDRMKKMPIFAREKVGHVWLVDPREAPIPPAFLWGKDAPPAAATEGP